LERVVRVGCQESGGWRSEDDDRTLVPVALEVPPSVGDGSLSSRPQEHSPVDLSEVVRHRHARFQAHRSNRQGSLIADLDFDPVH
jgi:hypothetical protein